VHTRTHARTLMHTRRRHTQSLTCTHTHSTLRHTCARIHYTPAVSPLCRAPVGTGTRTCLAHARLNAPFLKMGTHCGRIAEWLSDLVSARTTSRANHLCGGNSQTLLSGWQFSSASELWLRVTAVAKSSRGLTQSLGPQFPQPNL
jgi:hypothetical protein